MRYIPGEVGESLDIAVNRTGRYIRVQLRQSGILSMAEVQVLSGSSSNGGNIPLLDGVAVSAGVERDGWNYYVINSNADHQSLMVNLTGLDADGDIYVRAGSRPSGHYR